MKKVYFVLFLIVFCGTAAFLWCEDGVVTDLDTLPEYIGRPVRIITVQGGGFQGVLKTASEDRIELVDKDGLIVAVDMGSVEACYVFQEDVGKETFFQDSASNRLVIMPTGFSMEPGEFHVADQEVAAVTMSYGLNEHVSFWGGISVPGFLVNARYIATFAPKLAASFGSFAGLSWLEDLSVGVLIPYTIASYGEPNNNFTFGGGPLLLYDKNADPIFDVEGFVIAFGGKKVITASTSLISENWVYWGRRPIYTDGMTPIPDWYDYEPEDEEWDPFPLYMLPALVFRIAGRRLSWDIGALFPLEISNSEEIVLEGEGEDDDTGYYKNTKYKLQGLGGTVVPIPIVSITYRID